MPAKIISQFTKLSRRGLSMQTYYSVECECGRRNTFYALSWGGHRKLRCKGCGAFIYKDTLRVQPNTRLHTDGADEPEHTGIPETCKHPECVALFQSPAGKA